MRRWISVLLVCVGCAMGAGPAVAGIDPLNGVTGPQTLFVIPAGNSSIPPPSRADVEATYAKVAGWLNVAAAGVATFGFQVAAPVTVPDSFASCDTDPDLHGLRVAAQNAAGAAGDVPSATAIVIVVGQVICDRKASGYGWAGEAWVEDATGRGAQSAEHEIGHTLGLLHSARCIGATSWALSTTVPCPQSIAYGDGLDVMGMGTGLYDAFHLARLHWAALRPISHDGTYPLAAIEQGGGGLAVETSGIDYSIEYRDHSGLDSDDWFGMPNEDVLVHRTPVPDDLLASTDSILIGSLDASPGATDHDLDPEASQLVVPGLFEIAVAPAPEGRAISFHWLDATPPETPTLPPAVLEQSLTPGILIDGGQDAGSGFDHYEVSIDGGQPFSVAGIPSLADTSYTRVDTMSPDARAIPPTPLTFGAHTVTAVAVDRAGNRSPAATRTIVVGDIPAGTVHLRIGWAGGCGADVMRPCHRVAGDQIRVQAWSLAPLPGRRVELLLSSRSHGRFVVSRRIPVRIGPGLFVRASISLPDAGDWRIEVAVNRVVVAPGAVVRVAVRR